MSNHNLPPVIMVIDDTPANLKLLEEMLQGPGYRVVQFPRGAMALRAAAKHPPDLILLDIIMPEMDGLEVCRQLKANEALKDIPVLFISALDDTDDKIKAFAAGGVDYVTKPFQQDEVLARVRTHLELHKQAMRIEEQKRELQEEHDRLRELEGLRDNLVHMIVHDMRSPLMVMAGAYDIIQMEKERLSPTQLQFVLMGQNDCLELMGMVSSLLDVSRLEAGQMPLHRAPCDLMEIAAASAQSLAILAEEKQLNICIEGVLCVGSIDREIIQRVVVNLLGNAIKFSPQGGTIFLTISDSEDCVNAAITDEGVGIPSQYHQRIFEKFGQVKDRKKLQKPSTGLGLTFCKLAVEAHGGSIGIISPLQRMISLTGSATEASSPPSSNAGSTFWFSLPKSRSSAMTLSTK